MGISLVYFWNTICTMPSLCANEPDFTSVWCRTCWNSEKLSWDCWCLRISWGGGWCTVFLLSRIQCWTHSVLKFCLTIKNTLLNAATLANGIHILSWNILSISTYGPIVSGQQPDLCQVCWWIQLMSAWGAGLAWVDCKVMRFLFHSSGSADHKDPQRSHGFTAMDRQTDR